MSVMEQYMLSEQLTHMDYHAPIWRQGQTQGSMMDGIAGAKFNPWSNDGVLPPDGHGHDHGHMSSSHRPGRIELGDLVWAYRITPWFTWDLEKAVVFNVWDHSDLVDIQFLSDQHKARHFPMRSVRPVNSDFTPQYPKVRLAPGEPMPTRTEIREREMWADRVRDCYNLPRDAPLPGTPMTDAQTLRPGEVLKDGKVCIEIPRWGIPATTLDALRNRSIPCHQVGAVYGRHFYTNLYQNKFYPQEPKHVNAYGKKTHVEEGPKVVGHHYIPLEGPELDQDLATGEWYANEEAVLAQ